MKKVIMGNHAVSHGARLSRVEVIAAYPITPQTQVVEELATLCAEGVLKARFIKVESEHSAMASCIGASIGGARAFTATSSQGLALMHELLHWASGSRLPIVMANINRAMGPPWSVYTDQTDSLAQRDTGWLQFYCESNQEVLDTVIQAYRVSEQVLLPSMIVLDAFYLSHTYEPVDIPEQALVDQYLPPYRPPYPMDVSEPHAFGALAAPDTYFELRYKIQKAMEEAVEAIRSADREFQRLFGRSYGLIEGYHMDDAEIVLVTSATVTGTARVVVNSYRRRGVKVGLLKIRTFRPFPFEEVRKALAPVPKVAVIDRNRSPGHGGIFFQEVKSALFNALDGVRPKLFGFIAGLGGRDITPETLSQIIDYTLQHEEPKSDILWAGVKSKEPRAFITEQ